QSVAPKFRLPGSPRHCAREGRPQRTSLIGRLDKERKTAAKALGVRLPLGPARVESTTGAAGASPAAAHQTGHEMLPHPAFPRCSRDPCRPRGTPSRCIEAKQTQALIPPGVMHTAPVPPALAPLPAVEQREPLVDVPVDLDEPPPGSVPGAK